MRRRNFFFMIVRFSQRHSIAVIVITLALTLFFGYFAAGISLNADYNSLLPPESETNQRFQEFNANSEANGNLIVTYQSEQMFTPEVLEVLEEMVAGVESYENILVGTHMFSLVTAIKKGNRLVVVPASPHTEGAWTEEEALEFRKRLMADKVAKNLVISEDGEMVLFYFPTESAGDGNDELYQKILTLVEPLREYGEPSLNGTLAINDRVSYFLVRDLFMLLGISFLVIMIVYYFSFKAKRAVFLPLTVVVFGVIWCLGIMKLLGFELTIFNIITPPLVLTLGSSYSIHLLNEYYRTGAAVRRRNDRTWIAGAVQHINRTIILACLTSVAGFLSLLLTQIEQFRQFGISTAIGITVCAVLTLFYLPAALHNLSNPKLSQRTHVTEGGLTRVVVRISDMVIRHWHIILVLFLALVAAFIFAVPHVEFETNYTKYFSKDDPLVVSSNRYTRKIGGVDTIYVTLQAKDQEKGYFLDPEVLREVDVFEQSVVSLTDDITHNLSFTGYVKFLDGVMDGHGDIPESPGLIMLLSRYLSLITGMDENNAELGMLIDEEQKQMTISLRYRDTANMATTGLENTEHVLDAVAQSAHLLPDELEVITWGNGERYMALSDMIQRDQRVSTLASILVVFLITSVTFGSLGYGFFSIIPIAVGIMANYIFMVAANIPFDMITMGFSSVTVGVGIDDAIHFILRYRELCRDESLSLSDRIRETVVQTGRPIMLTSVSIISGLMVLSFASFMPVRYFGILISIALFNTLLATLFILPAMMYGGLSLYEKYRRPSREM